jgi:hypothetical protein
MDEVFSGPQKRFRPPKNFLINRPHSLNFRLSVLNSKTLSSFFPDDNEDQCLNPSSVDRHSKPPFSLNITPRRPLL